jgi:hypothetical protein
MHNYSPFYAPFAPALLYALLPVFIVGVLWIVAIKGYALWNAARNGQKEWFIALLIINTLGILEIIYLVWFRPSSHSHSDTPARSSSSRA